MSVVFMLFALAVQGASAEDGKAEASPAPGRGLAAEAEVIRLEIQGECPDLRAWGMSGLSFESYDTAANGKTMYKAQLNSQWVVYLYYDLDCDGSEPLVGASWMISVVGMEYFPPNSWFSWDLDQDGKCRSLAYLDGDSWWPSPPSKATWEGACLNNTYSNVTLTFTRIYSSTSMSTSMQTYSPAPAPTATTTTAATTTSITTIVSSASDSTPKPAATTTTTATTSTTTMASRATVGSASDIGSTMGFLFAFVVICGGCGYGFYRWWSRRRVAGADKSVTEQQPVVVQTTASGVAVVQSAPTTASGVAIVVVEPESIMEIGGMADEQASVTSVPTQHTCSLQ